MQPPPNPRTQNNNITVTYSTSDITASAASGDYTAKTAQTLTFTPATWNVSQTISVPVILDNQVRCALTGSSQLSDSTFAFELKSCICNKRPAVRPPPDYLLRPAGYQTPRTIKHQVPESDETFAINLTAVTAVAGSGDAPQLNQTAKDSVVTITNVVVSSQPSPSIRVSLQAAPWWLVP